MEAKIPISCISDINNENKKFIDSIQCRICGGIFFEPILLKIDKYIVCKNCFFNKYKINNIDKIEKDKINMLIEKIAIKKIDALFKFKYFCPLCKSNNSITKEYSYEDLISHLMTCENQMIFKDLCRCTNIIKIYLKDINMDINDYKIMLDNKILEKEIEMEKLTINYKKFQNYLNSEEKENNFIQKIQKKNIKKKFIGKKRKDNK